jgi:hypothetical protein
MLQSLSWFAKHSDDHVNPERVVFAEQRLAWGGLAAKLSVSAQQVFDNFSGQQ